MRMGELSYIQKHAVHVVHVVHAVHAVHAVCSVQCIGIKIFDTKRGTFQTLISGTSSIAPLFSVCGGGASVVELMMYMY